MADAAVFDSDRASLDRDIRTDGQVLSAVIRLLREGTRLSDWPAHAAAALESALWPQGGNRFEDAKAGRLRYHLFVDLAPPPFPPTDAVPGRWSDRIRADLPDLVPFATGLNMLND